MAFVVLTEPRPKEAMQCLLRRSVYALIPFSLLCIKFFPAYRHWVRTEGGPYVDWNYHTKERSGTALHDCDIFPYVDAD